MKAYEKIDILLHQSHCSIVPENTALLFPNLLHFILPKSLYFFFLFTTLRVTVSFLVLGLLYFYLGFALFNDIPFRKILVAESYKGIGVWRLATAIGAGFALSTLSVGFMFTILSYPMARTLLTYGSGLVVIILILALVMNIRKKNNFYRSILLRCLAGGILALALLLSPGIFAGKP